MKMSDKSLFLILLSHGEVYAESTAGLSVALIPVSSDVGFSMSEATPVIEQLVNDGLLTPARAVVLLS